MNWSARNLTGVLTADAAWDTFLAGLLLAATWPSGAAALGLPTGPGWPVNPVLAVGCLVFAALLVRAARGVDTAAVPRAASGANALGALAAVACAAYMDALGPNGVVLVALAGAGCAVFAVLERLGTRRAPAPA